MVAWILWLIGLLLLTAAAAILFLLVRVRMIGRIVGTFECWVRPDNSSGWVYGMARFGSREFQWFRLVGFYVGPQFRMPRVGMTVSNPIARSDGNMVEVIVESAGRRMHIATRTHWYNGIVSWVESGPPMSRLDL
ncbi:DUF2550 family protein [Gleimia hominis]|uniref:DUF2550 family protein n=1 Tax=Gleimia hominis TaxID=595468 RepID=A0ABU3IAK8_9ACTO|nr:DUF2550 family protein [Gleimia hominis]MDT3767409.1 DUF2550 family protein [Gleimia hominis]